MIHVEPALFHETNQRRFSGFNFEWIVYMDLWGKMRVSFHGVLNINVLYVYEM